MTPLQIAKEECANYRREREHLGACLGAVIEEDGSIHRCRPRPACVVGTPGIRCQYFEECVLPMIPKIDNPKRRTEFEEGAKQYRLAANVTKTVKRVCECGRELEKAKRFCYLCREAHRKESIRQRNQRRG